MSALLLSARLLCGCTRDGSIYCYDHAPRPSPTVPEVLAGEQRAKDQEARVMEWSGPTPGPWIVSCRDGAWEIEAPRDRTLGLMILARCFPWPEIAEESHANGRLMAAAPELLHTCKRVVAWLDRLAEAAEDRARDTRFASLAEANAADAKNYRATMRDIQKAIDKAEGR